MKLNYRHTVLSCCVGYVAQAIVLNYIPLLYVTFQSEFGISLQTIALLTTVCFGVQLLIDLLAGKFVDKIGYRACGAAGNFLCAFGLVLLAFLPRILPPMAGLLTASLFYSAGAGLLEVIVSPVVEACPTKHKESVMGFLHSAYCWGSVAVVLVSTLFFSLFGIGRWKLFACLWAIPPLVNAVFFLFVPLYKLPGAEEGAESGAKPANSFSALVRKPIFWLFVLLMLCAGASEQAVSQWASAFAEQGLGVSKTVGDLAGPLAFAVLMGLCRVFYAANLRRISLEKFLLIGAAGCVAAYLLISLPPLPALNLVGCALCGLFVGILWPGTYSLASKAMPTGGTTMFALLALAGDLGCLSGPTLVGLVSGAAGDSLKAGILAAIAFPLLAVFGAILILRKKKKDALPLAEKD
ncbi:MAG TPA: MFS transporter [Candidatus Scatosoma pullicola]|nr:MFS transporter [Candidatus Scatosoma pullicola]